LFTGEKACLSFLGISKGVQNTTFVAGYFDGISPEIGDINRIIRKIGGKGYAEF